MAYSVLLHGHDAVLLDTRRMVLEVQGFEVLSSMQESTVLKALVSRRIDLLILCHTLSKEECDHLLDSAKRYQPAMKRLVLYLGYPACGIHEEGILSALEGPAAFAHTVNHLLAA
jgi:DNA-binding response OmpR family regulator